MARILVTGAAGFIGYHTSERLLARGDEVVGLDNVNNYYDPTLKEARLARLARHPGFRMMRLELGDRDGVERVFREERFDRVIHLAAQAGVRYSLTNPHAYIDSNLVGFLHILEGCRHHGVQHLTYASSSSVRRQYGDAVLGASERRPSRVTLRRDEEGQRTDGAHLQPSVRPAHHGAAILHGVRSVGRPDMALFLFTKAILEGQPIDVFNHGKMQRDFTYVDDIVEGVIRTSDHIAAPNPEWDSDRPDPATSKAPYRIYNIGNNNPVELMHLITTLEQALGRTAEKRMLPIQPGDVPATYADVDALVQDVGFAPRTSIETGVANFVAWYRDYYRVGA